MKVEDGSIKRVPDKLSMSSSLVQSISDMTTEV